MDHGGPNTNPACPAGKIVRVDYMNIRECAGMISFNPRLSLQDNLNNLVKQKLNEVPNLHRVISMNYTESSSVMRKNCALCTVWFETLVDAPAPGTALATPSSTTSAGTD
ncbi:hypothetical protein H9P43_008636 [Blastocladiella emersonii ATCC 22665]|nr:hypothetical protein H9P43_008636 [Blastocladiella emersonii ATCC 22665]